MTPAPCSPEIFVDDAFCNFQLPTPKSSGAHDARHQVCINQRKKYIGMDRDIQNGLVCGFVCRCPTAAARHNRTTDREKEQSSRRTTHSTRKHLKDPPSNVALDVGIQLSEAHEGLEGLVFQTWRGGRKREQRGQPAVKISLLFRPELRACAEADHDSVTDNGFRVVVAGSVLFWCRRGDLGLWF